MELRHGGAPILISNPQAQEWVLPNQRQVNLVDTTATQTLTNKTLESPTITGVMTGVSITSGTMNNVDIVGGSIESIQDILDSEIRLCVMSKNRQTGTITTLSGAADAISISAGDVFILAGAPGVNNATLAAPTADDEGRIIWVKSGSANAHTLTVEGTTGLGGSGATYDVITFTNVVAANVTLRAYGLHWYLVGSHLATVA